MLEAPFARVLGPRRLTSDEVDKEVWDITNRTWPHADPILPMKNLYDHRTGCIFRTSDVDPETIIPEVALGEGGMVKYTTLKAMVEAGWVVD